MPEKTAKLSAPIIELRRQKYTRAPELSFRKLTLPSWLKIGLKKLGFIVKSGIAKTGLIADFGAEKTDLGTRKN